MKIILLFIIIAVNAFGVITIAPVDIGKKSGFSGKLEGSFETKRGNSDVDNYSAGLRAQYDNNESYVLWSDFILSYAKASGKVNTNKTYAHVRFVHTFMDVKPLNYELFVQSSTNEFTNVKRRQLLGGGLRYHKNMNKYGSLYFGLGTFYEYVRYLSNADSKEERARINSYISYTKMFNKKSKLSYVLYYQPDVEAFDDYIFSSGLELEILIYEKLYLKFVFYYDIDTKPANNVEDTDITQKTSFIYKF